MPLQNDQSLTWLSPLKACGRNAKTYLLLYNQISDRNIIKSYTKESLFRTFSVLAQGIGLGNDYESILTYYSILSYEVEEAFEHNRIRKCDSLESWDGRKCALCEVAQACKAMEEE